MRARLGLQLVEPSPPEDTELTAEDRAVLERISDSVSRAPYEAQLRRLRGARWADE